MQPTIYETLYGKGELFFKLLNSQTLVTCLKIAKKERLNIIDRVGVKALEILDVYYLYPYLYPRNIGLHRWTVLKLCQAVLKTASLIRRIASVFVTVSNPTAEDVFKAFHPRPIFEGAKFTDLNKAPGPQQVGKDDSGSDDEGFKTASRSESDDESKVYSRVYSDDEAAGEA